MAKRATPHSGTAYGPSYLLHGRDTQLRSNDSLKAHCVKENINHDRRLKNLKQSRMAYKAVVKANQKAHWIKKFYNPKANTHNFDVNELV